MRRDGLLHPDLLALAADLGHGQTVCVADPGLPVPSHVPTISLAWAPGRPPMPDVVELMLAELVVESAATAEELDPDSPLGHRLNTILADAGVPVETVPHDDIKTRLDHCVAVVRTGEFTPYANVILTAGVPF